jgi:hypothetical protein
MKEADEYNLSRIGRRWVDLQCWWTVSVVRGSISRSISSRLPGRVIGAARYEIEETAL